MKGLEKIPGNLEFLRAYEKLQQSNPAIITPEEVALWSQWSRFDPRLAEQLVSYLSLNWKQISPIVLHEALLKQPWPAALGVLLEQAELFSNNAPPHELGLFRNWSKCVMAGIPAVRGEQYFIGLRSFAGKQMQEDAVLAIYPYRTWGFLGQEILINKVSALNSRNLTLIPPQARKVVLNEWLKTHRRIDVPLYRKLLNERISCRQAERDLKTHPKLTARGKTRGRVYWKIF